MEKKSIGSFLAALRKSNGMTQQEVADRLNVSNKTVSKWERDESYPEITLIPVIAELFNVTSDEILRGERIPKGDSFAERSENKAEKQIKRIINSSITRFKNISYVSLALAFAGLICLFTIAYAFYRPVLAFGIFLLFVIASFLLELIQYNTTNTSVKDNELFESRDELLLPLKNMKIKYMVTVILTNIIIVVFALPIILMRNSHYPNSVITMDSYIIILPIILLVALFLSKLGYYLLNKMIIKEDKTAVNPFLKKRMNSLNLLQSLIVTLQYLTLAIVRNGEAGKPSGTIAVAAIFVPILLMIISMLVFIMKGKGLNEKFLLALAGIRNTFYGFAGFYLVFGLIAHFLSTEGRVGTMFPAIFYVMLWAAVITTILYEAANYHLMIKANND